MYAQRWPGAWLLPQAEGPSCAAVAPRTGRAILAPSWRRAEAAAQAAAGGARGAAMGCGVSRLHAASQQYQVVGSPAAGSRWQQQQKSKVNGSSCSADSTRGSAALPRSRTAVAPEEEATTGDDRTHLPPQRARARTCHAGGAAARPRRGSLWGLHGEIAHGRWAAASRLLASVPAAATELYEGELPLHQLLASASSSQIGPVAHTAKRDFVECVRACVEGHPGACKTEHGESGLLPLHQACKMELLLSRELSGTAGGRLAPPPPPFPPGAVVLLRLWTESTRVPLQFSRRCGFCCSS
jgi:hypothetical protein